MMHTGGHLGLNLNCWDGNGFECIDARTFGHHLCIYECAQHLDTYEYIYYVVMCDEITVWTIYILICCSYYFKINYFSMRLTLFSVRMATQKITFNLGERNFSVSSPRPTEKYTYFLCVYFFFFCVDILTEILFLIWPNTIFLCV